MGMGFDRECGVSEFHSRTVWGKNENLHASVREVPSEKRVTFNQSIK